MMQCRASLKSCNEYFNWLNSMVQSEAIFCDFGGQQRSTVHDKLHQLGMIKLFTVHLQIHWLWHPFLLIEFDVKHERGC